MKKKYTTEEIVGTENKLAAFGRSTRTGDKAKVEDEGEFSQVISWAQKKKTKRGQRQQNTMSSENHLSKVKARTGGRALKGKMRSCAC